jgi:cytochrome c553
MRRLLALSLLAAMALAACHRESAPPATASNAAPASNTAPSNNTAAMGAAPASAPQQTAQANPTGPVIAPSTASVEPAANQDVGAGRTIATQGSGAAAACMGCHGANGEGNPQAGFPRLAALGRMYIEHQLNSYADGTRQNQVMTPIAAALDPQQRAAVAAFYASLSTPGAAPNAANKNAGSAPVLVTRGDDKRGLQACVNCHGVQGIGDAAANPYLAGQNATYLTNVMGEWRDGSRHNDPSGQMPLIAKALNDAETKQIAAYFSSLPAPAPRNAQAAAMAVNTSRPAVQSGPVGATAPAQGTGTQQGAPLTGGSQGQGSGGAATNPGQTTR